MKPPTPGMLRGRAARGTLEVEHLLAAARAPSAALAAVLRELAVEHGWRFAPCLPDIPFASWGEVVVLYCDGGLAALSNALNEEAKRAFAVSLLVELGDEAALAAVLKAADALIEQGLEPLAFADDIAYAINRFGMLGLGQAAATASGARLFLEAFLQHAVSDAHLGLAMCGLRYFGDEGSLSLVRSARTLSPSWEAARTAAVRGILKRLRETAGSV